jgi:predicted transposase YdaD
MRNFVYEPWVDTLEVGSLEKFCRNYVPDNLRSQEGDVIWRIKCQDTWLYVYLLIEFQSTADSFISLRLMSYVSLLSQDLIKSQKFKKRQKLPPVLHNGKKHWNVSELIADLPQSSIGRYKPSLRYLAIDKRHFSQNEPDPFENINDLGELRDMLEETVKGWEKKWKEEGIKEGFEKGLKQGKLEIAKTMLQKGLDRQIVIEITGLSEEVVLRLIH